MIRQSHLPSLGQTAGTPPITSPETFFYCILTPHVVKRLLETLTARCHKKKANSAVYIVVHSLHYSTQNCVSEA